MITGIITCPKGIITALVVLRDVTYMPINTTNYLINICHMHYKDKGSEVLWNFVISSSISLVITINKLIALVTTTKKEPASL